MPNLLLDATRWTDQAVSSATYGASPPPQWNGSTYEFFDQYSSGFNAIIGAVADAGDKVAFSLDVKVAGSPSGSAAELTVNGVAVWTQDVSAVGTFSFTSAALAAGDSVDFKVPSLPGDIYTLDAVLTPLLVAPDPCKRLQFEVQMTSDPEDS